MRLHGINQSIKEVLEKSFYIVPRFQRPYSWEEEQVLDLWNDLVIYYNREYFIGSIVVYNIDQYNNGVVDGQQRLMTLTILLAALRDILSELKQSDLAHGIQNFIEKRDVRNQTVFVVNQETSYPYFHKKIQTFPVITSQITTSEELKIESAYKLMREKILELIKNKSKRKQVEKIEEIREKVLSAQVILIQLDNEDDAYVAFEILNSRGKNLGLADLVKNHILRMLPNRNKMLDIAKDDWNKVQSNINKIDEMDMDKFLRHYYNSIQGSTPEKALYKKFKAMIQRKNAADQMKYLVSESDRYCKINIPYLYPWTKSDLDISKPLIAIKAFGITVSAPLLLTALRRYESSKMSRRQLLRALSVLEQFHFEYSAVCSKKSSGGLASLFGSIAKRLEISVTNSEVDDTLRDLSTRLTIIKPDKPEFITEFKKIEYGQSFTKSGRLVKYIFSKAESDLYKSVTVDWENMSIEHFLAQNATLPNRTSAKQVINIGNLFLLSPKYNSDLGNLSPKEKIAKMKAENIPVDHYISTNAAGWDGSKILVRAEYLAEKLWRSSL